MYEDIFTELNALMSADYHKQRILQEIFMINVYEYYLNGGVYNTLTSKIANIFSWSFKALFLFFTFILIDWVKMSSTTFHTYISMSELISYESVLHPNFFQFLIIVFVLVSICYSIYNTVKLIYNIHDILESRDFYNNTLKLTDTDLRCKKWVDIANCISVNVKDIPVSHIVSLLMKKENYFIGLFNENMLKLPSANWLNTQLEKNLFYILFNKDISRHSLESIKRECFIFGIINLLCIPITLIHYITTYLFQNIDDLYLKQNFFGQRRYTNAALWKFRQYNELPHLFNDRINLSYPAAQEYIQQFPSKITEILASISTVVSGAFIFLFLTLSCLDENILIYVTVGGRSLFFYVGIATTTAMVSRSYIRSPEKKVSKSDYYLNKWVKNAMYYPSSWKNNTIKAYNDFLGLFQPGIMNFFNDIKCVFTTPYYLLCILPNELSSIRNFCIEHTDHILGVGNICKYSNFLNTCKSDKFSSSVMLFNKTYTNSIDDTEI